MTSSEIKRDFTPDQIIQLVQALGSPGWRKGSGGELIFQTVCHHGSSYKLYYYPSSGRFHCYTECGDTFDAYELTRRSRGCTFQEARRFIDELFGIAPVRRAGFVPSAVCTDDWELFQRYSKPEAAQPFTPTIYPAALTELFAPVPAVEWLKEGISSQAMARYDIRFDVSHNKIIIPQYDPNGDLVGIRGRALDEDEVAAGRKYMPVTLEGLTLRHPTAYNLYGLWQNHEAIRQVKKIMLFEGEKSVLKCEDYYGSGNFTAAVCGSSISNYQRELILTLGVKEVFIAFDKEYHEAFTPESDAYAEKILSLAYKFCPYVTTYILWDTEDLLSYKESPADRGKEVLERLMAQKYEVTTKEEE